MYINQAYAETILARTRVGGWQQINGHEIQRLSDTEFTMLSQADRREHRNPTKVAAAVGSMLSVIPLLAELVTATCDLQGRIHATCYHCGERIHEQHVTASAYWNAPWVHCDPTVGHGADIRPAA